MITEPEKTPIIGDKIYHPLYGFGEVVNGKYSYEIKFEHETLYWGSFPIKFDKEKNIFYYPYNKYLVDHFKALPYISHLREKYSWLWRGKPLTEEVYNNFVVKDIIK